MSFDFLARHYDWLEALTAGRRLERMRAAGLDALRGRRRILSMGEGHGRFAAACVARYPDAELTCVDASERMLARARRRIATIVSPDRAARITWQCADVLSWSSEQKFDAIVTCFFLDCFPAARLESVVTRLAQSAARDAVWINVDFAVPARGWKRWRAQAIHALMYAFFRVTTRLPARRWTAPDELLAAQGFRLESRSESEWGLLRADVWRRRGTGDPAR
jgi:ubiquinone/menaquinone biosynthesis C-methylase UbiE